MASRYSIKRIGFSTNPTNLRPPAGQVWRVLFAEEVGNAGQIVRTNGTINQDYGANSSRNQPLLTNEWYFTMGAQTNDTTGFLIHIENLGVPDSVDSI